MTNELSKALAHPFTIVLAGSFLASVGYLIGIVVGLIRIIQNSFRPQTRSAKYWNTWWQGKILLTGTWESLNLTYRSYWGNIGQWCGRVPSLRLMLNRGQRNNPVI